MDVICYMVYIRIILLCLNELTDDFLRPMMISGTEVVEALSSLTVTGLKVQNWTIIASELN